MWKYKRFEWLVKLNDIYNNISHVDFLDEFQVCFQNIILFIFVSFG